MSLNTLKRALFQEMRCQLCWSLQHKVVKSTADGFSHYVTVCRLSYCLTRRAHSSQRYQVSIARDKRLQNTRDKERLLATPWAEFHSAKCNQKPELELGTKASRAKNKEKMDLQEDISLEQVLAIVKRICTNLYVIDENVAKKIVSTVQAHRENPQTPILEIQAGGGVVSKEFLQQGVSRVIALERHRAFEPLLQALEEEYGKDRLQYFKWGMMNFFRKLNFQAHPEVEAYQRLEGLVRESLQDETVDLQEQAFSIFALGGKKNNLDLLQYLVRAMPVEGEMVARRGVEVFLLLAPHVKLKLEFLKSLQEKDEEKERISSLYLILFLFYDIQFLDEIDANDVWGPQGKTKKTSQNRAKRDLVKISLKRNVEQLLPLDKHEAFYYFIKQLYIKSSHRVIPSIEKLVPGCGLRAIDEGIRMTDIIKTTKPEKILNLYKKLIHWPEYASSPLSRHLDYETTGTLDAEGHDPERNEADEEGS